jgi:predicted outer membrane repeat protein
VVVSASTLQGNSGDAGGSVLVKEGLVEVAKSLFVDGRAYEGGAVQCLAFSGAPMLWITDTTFLSNSARASGGAVNSNCGARIVSSMFTQNSAAEFGGKAGFACTHIPAR